MNNMNSNNENVITKQPQNGKSKLSMYQEDEFEKDDNDEDQRDQWGGQMEFLLAALGNSVGLGNCWRFPYLCYKNGGGAFLFPYLICCAVIGMPLFMIELGMGQYSGMGPAHLYANLSPIFKGVGIASVISSAIVAIYYNMIIAWTIFYFVESFLGQKWQTCDHWFNTINCTSIKSGHNFTNSSISSTEEFFNNFVLTKSAGIEQIDAINWNLVLALLASWIIVVLSLIKGIQSSGKVVYFTATFPYVILTILFARGVTLDGALDGLRYYFTPNWTRVKDIEVWRDAAVQVIYSFGVGGGGMITYASYNRFHNPVIRHSIIVGLGDFLTSIFCGAVVFTMIGYMATALDKPIDSIVQSGTGLAFIVIPEGLSSMPVSIFWSMLFFGMLFMLGIDSQFAMVETVITYIFDTIRNGKKSGNKKLNKPLVVCVVGVLWFIAGLPLCTNAGVYILNIFDTYAAGIPCLVIGILEIFIIVFIYGVDRFFDNMHQMTGWKPHTLIKSHFVVTISILTPAVIIVILYRETLSLFEAETSLKYGNYSYPTWAGWIGWGLSMFSIIAIPIGMLHQIFVTLCSSSASLSSSSIGETLKALVQPTKRWWSNEQKNSNGKCSALQSIIQNNSTTFSLKDSSSSNETLTTTSNGTRPLAAANANYSIESSSESTTNGHVNPGFTAISEV